MGHRDPECTTAVRLSRVQKRRVPGLKIVRWLLMVVGGFTVAGMLAVAGLVGYLMIEDKIREFKGDDALSSIPSSTPSSEGASS